VVDIGTAITYDWLQGKEFIKEVQYLRDYGCASKPLTATLPDCPDRKYEVVDIIGSSTVECISSGVINGTTLEIDGYIDKISSIYDDCMVVLTGGDAYFLANMLKIAYL